MLRRLTLSASLLLLFAPAALAGSRLEFQVTFDKAVSPTPFTGRVFVLLSSANRSSDKPPLTLNWFNPEPAFAIDVKDWKPGCVLGEPVRSTSNCKATPLVTGT